MMFVILPVVVQKILVFPALTAVIPFPVVGHCRHHLETLHSNFDTISYRLSSSFGSCIAISGCH